MADFGPSLRFADVYGESAALIRRNIIPCGIGALIMFSAKTISDFGVRQWLPARSMQAALGGLPILVVLGVIHFWLITRLMQGEGMADQAWSPGRLLSFLIAYVLAMLGMILGMLLLIVPGVIMGLRWTVYANFVIGRGLAPLAAMKASWAATRGSASTLFAVFLVFGIVHFGGYFLMRGFKSQTAISTASLLASNIWTEVFDMFGLCMTTAIYFLLTDPDHTRLTEVFA